VGYCRQQPIGSCTKLTKRKGYYEHGSDNCGSAGHPKCLDKIIHEFVDFLCDIVPPHRNSQGRFRYSNSVWDDSCEASLNSFHLSGSIDCTDLTIQFVIVVGWLIVADARIIDSNVAKGRLELRCLFKCLPS
jgi:hypothetical protein